MFWMNKMRRVFIIRKDLHLSSGKLAAMVAHCAEAYWTNMIRGEVPVKRDGDDLVYVVKIDADIYDEYVNASFTKTICEARNLNQLSKAEEVAKELKLVEGVDYGFIDDNCLTELKPEFIGADGKPYCRVGMWFKPLPDETAHLISKKYPLYRD